MHAGANARYVVPEPTSPGAQHPPAQTLRSAHHRFVRGRADMASGALPEAIAQYRAALELDPGNSQLHMRLGAALRAAGDLEQSAHAYWSSIDLNPLAHESHLHLGNVLALAWQRREPSCAPEIEPALRLEAQERVRSAESAIAAGRNAEGLQILTSTARRLPYSPGIHNRIGWVLWQCGALEQALVHYDLAVRFQPDWLDGLEQASSLAASLGLAERALGYLRAAQRIKPSDALSVRIALALPAIEPSTQSIDLTRERCEQSLDRLLATRLDIPDPFLTSQVSLFYLSYHGKCNRHLNSKVAQLFTQACPQLAWVAPHAREPRKPTGRIKVGFISHFIRDHSIGKTTAGLVEQLSRNEFEVFVINLYPQPEDETSRRVRQHADHYLSVDASLDGARRQIAALQLDVLFYQDIGMESFGYFLAYSRLAPVQCVSYGHPDTTGIPNIDYFISNDLYELPGAAQHYCERLFLLHDLPTLAYYHRPTVDVQTPSRARFGLSDDEHIYLCPQTLFKIHPTFDNILAGILRRDPRSRILLLRNHCEQWRVKLTERFKSSMPDVSARVSFLPALPRRDFMQLMASADVVLDTTHFNGMNSSLEAFCVGAPVVTLPTTLQRGRHTQAMYRKMEIEDCVAVDEHAYIEIATRVCSDPAYRAELGRRILERNAVLYENDAVTREFERFFASAVQAACS
jgi:protein O-GlcNAc transferase